MLTINDQDLAISKFLADNNIKCSVSYRSTTTRDDWECDQWEINISGERFDYYTGLGHRINLKKHRLDRNGKLYLDKLRKLYYDETNRYIHKSHDFATNAAIKPTQASFIYCLFSDSDLGSESFDDFCDNLGYDNDSMKAFDNYKACMETKRKFSKIFTFKQLEEIREILQDY